MYEGMEDPNTDNSRCSQKDLIGEQMLPIGAREDEEAQHNHSPWVRKKKKSQGDNRGRVDSDRTQKLSS